jgi:hypothetical protein
MLNELNELNELNNTVNDSITNELNDTVTNNTVNDTNLFLENNNNFKVLIIDFGEIKHLSWNSLDYLHKLLDLDLFKIVETNRKELSKLIIDELYIEKYNNISGITDYICENKEYIYEMMYLNIEKKDVNEEDTINEAATLINTNGKTIYSKAIVFKSYLPHNNNSILLDNITKEDIINFMDERINTNVVLYDDTEFKDMKICGDLNKFAEEFFDGEGFIKTEFNFLAYNINIWYTTDSGSKDVFSKLIQNPVYSCIIFIKLEENIRGSIYIDEVKKIINLSHKLESFDIPEEYLEEKKDIYHRKIVNNKYRILSKLYSKYN